MGNEERDDRVTGAELEAEQETPDAPKEPDGDSPIADSAADSEVADGADSLQADHSDDTTEDLLADDGEPPSDHVRVVAIGASAGGLEPIEQFFDAMPADSGLAFVIVQHLSPDFRSMMDQLIARHSTMTIVHAKDGMAVRENVVYLNPPRTELTISNGVLSAQVYSENEIIGLPIDAFFRSLVEDMGDKAIGIIMSGTGSDGTRGGLAIREAGGTLIVQDPSSAKFDSMLLSAIGRGAATVTATPTDMPDIIKRLLAGETISLDFDAGADSDDPERAILALLQRRYGADFGYYKSTTVRRRIRRRALLNQIDSAERYAQWVREDPEELESLFCDLLIGVTAFFRDKEAFEALERSALPELAATMSEKRPLRVWVPGCASGEEAYSLAILVSEFARAHGLKLNLKIFATDIHHNSLEVASTGIFDSDSFKSVPKELVDRYFDPIGGRYQVKASLRGLIVFSPHNLLKDPPFTRMDLVSCRNLLIYFDEVAQKKVLALFHFALRQGGVLFLGPSESTNDLEKEFAPVDKRWRIYRKSRDIRLRESTHLLPLSGGMADSEARTQTLRESPIRSGIVGGGLDERQTLNRAYDVVLEKHAPTSLLVNRQGELRHIFGDAQKFLQLGEGVFSQTVTDLVHTDLKAVVSVGLERAIAPRAIPFRRNAKVTVDGKQTSVAVEIEQLTGTGMYAEFLLVTIEELVKKVSETIPVPESVDSDQEFYMQRVRELEHDLKITEESLQTTIEELETSNEELQATNEELMASNEELQSTNEELHSLNEELFTVSAEHQRKIEQLTELTDDMNNLLSAIDIGTIFLDSDLRIRRFTAASAKAFNLVEHDVDRPIEHITYRFNFDNLIESVRGVFASGVKAEHEVEVDGNAYLLRVLPYTNDNNDTAGVVLTIVDVQQLKSVQEKLTEANRQLAEEKQRFQDLYELSPVMMHSLDAEGTIVEVSNHWLSVMGYERDEVIGRKKLDFLTQESRDYAQNVIFPQFWETGVYVDAPYQMVKKDGGLIDVLVSAIMIKGPDGNTERSLSVVTNVTAKLAAERDLASVHAQLLAEQERLSRIYQNSPVMMHSYLEDGRLVEVSNYWCEKMGYAPDEVLGRPIMEFVTEETAKHMRDAYIPQLFGGASLDDVEAVFISKNGKRIEVTLSATEGQGHLGGQRQSFSVAFDITELRTAEKALEAQNTELARINDNLNQFTHIVSHDLTGPLRAIQHTTDWMIEDASPEAREEIKEHIERLKDQVAHLGSMLTDLLEYSRAGASQREAEIIDLPAALTEVFDVIEKPDGMILHVATLPRDLATFRAPILLVFRNLIENAVKYHDRDIGQINVSCEDLRDRWSFSVTDDGPGIDPKFHEKILLPFRKLERKDKVPGNGMGLALVKKAIETNGGELTITSNPSEQPGTTFTFTWPKNRAQSIAAE